MIEFVIYIHTYIQSTQVVFSFSHNLFFPSAKKIKFRPGQEEGNIPYVVDAGFGRYSDDPMVIGRTVREWLTNPEVLHQMQQAAYTASRPHATLDIARDIGEMLFEHIQNRDGMIYT